MYFECQNFFFNSQMYSLKSKDWSLNKVWIHFFKLKDKSLDFKTLFFEFQTLILEIQSLFFEIQNDSVK